MNTVLDNKENNFELQEENENGHIPIFFQVEKDYMWRCLFKKITIMHNKIEQRIGWDWSEFSFINDQENNLFIDTNNFNSIEHTLDKDVMEGQKESLRRIIQRTNIEYSKNN